MITVKTNIKEVAETSIELIQRLSNTDKMLRTCATTVLGLMKVRVHGEGLDADGNRIGTYSPGYMKVRTGNFASASKTKSGKLKNAGVFARGKNKGKPRPNYNRTADTKVILSLTRQMENDEKVIPLANGYGIGFTNPHNYDKSQWVEATYKRKGRIFAASQDELNAVNAVAQKFVEDAFSGNNS